MSSPEWSMKQALFCLIGSTCLTLILAVGGFWGYRNWKMSRMTNEKFRVVAIVQTGPEKEPLKTAYLAEVLGLSADRPSHLYSLDLKQAQAKLLTSPLIESAKIKRVPPGTLLIDYTIRKPLAILSDYANTAVDSEGYLFPIAPFSSPKQLTEIYLGLPSFGSAEDTMGRSGGSWQRPLKNGYFSLALEILRFIEDSPAKGDMRIKRIDVSHAFAPSLGQREIVLIAEDELIWNAQGKELVCVFPKILRLAPKDYRQQLGNFFSLRSAMHEDYKRQLASVQEGGRFASRIIDLRIPQLAFIENRS